jgi:replicative DNA helicase
VRYILDKKLRIVDSTLADSPREASNLAMAIKQNAGRHIILLDYFQLLNIGEKRNFEIWGKIAGDLIEACGDKNLIIAAAQFNRTNTEKIDGSSNYDPIAEQLRESASLEQLASLIIGAGWTADGIGTVKHNWKLLKDRYGQIGSDKYLKNNTPSEYRDRQFLAQNNNNWSIDPNEIENPLKNQKQRNTQFKQNDKKLWQGK